MLLTWVSSDYPENPIEIGYRLFLFGNFSIISEIVGRSIGFFSKNLKIRFTNFAEYNPGSGLGFLCTILYPSVIKLSPVYGGSKAATWYRTHPRAQIST